MILFVKYGYQLLNRQMDLEDVPVGLTPTQKSKCLTEKPVQISNTDLESKEPVCQICCDEDQVITLTEMICGHQMCKKCADKHFEKNVKCPFCNQDLRDILEAESTSNNPEIK